MPAANGSRIGIQFVSYLLPCAVMDVTVTENEPLIRILHSFNDRSYLLFQTDKGVDFLVDGILKSMIFSRLRTKGASVLREVCTFSPPRRRGYAACHFTKHGDFFDIGVYTLIEAVSLTQVFLCCHAATSVCSFRIRSSPSTEVNVLYHEEREETLTIIPHLPCFGIPRIFLQLFQGFHIVLRRWITMAFASSSKRVHILYLRIFYISRIGTDFHRLSQIGF